MEQLGTTSEPESFTRLGKPNERKKRTLKVVMKIKREKEDVLANLKLLKGTVEEFGKVSVTDDYNSHGREQIKSWVKIIIIIIIMNLFQYNIIKINRRKSLLSFLIPM